MVLIKKVHQLFIKLEPVANIKLNYFDMFFVGGELNYLPAYDKYKAKINEYISFRENFDHTEHKMSAEKIKMETKKLHLLEESIENLNIFVKNETGKKIIIDPICLESNHTICYRDI